MPEQSAPQSAHEHEWVFAYTNENWFDGDETDIYKCACGAVDKRYIPR